MVKFIITYSFVKLVPYKMFSGSKRQVMAFSANYPFLFSYPYRGECPGTFCFFARKTGLGKGKSLCFHFEEPIFRPKEVSIYSERRLCFSKTNKISHFYQSSTYHSTRATREIGSLFSLPNKNNICNGRKHIEILGKTLIHF